MHTIESNSTLILIKIHGSYQTQLFTNKPFLERSSIYSYS